MLNRTIPNCRYDSKNKEGSRTEGEARDPEKAKDMRDPMNVTVAFPMPEGAHFCPPVAEEGSAPYKEMAPGTNAFDYTQVSGGCPLGRGQAWASKVILRRVLVVVGVVILINSSDIHLPDQNILMVRTQNNTNVGIYHLLLVNENVKIPTT